MPAAHAEQSPRIREVWACNLDEEMKKMRPVIQQYNYVAMDTEFPGVVARPVGEFRSYADYQYQLLRCNVDWLKIIQLGLTFMNEQGECPPGTSTWQFNFKFNLKEDMYAQDSIKLLTMSGIQFKKHEEEGIEAQYFAELLMTSGVVLCEGVKWLSFHSGYDFGYFIKILTNSPLPEEARDFFEILKLFFPVIYDIKYLMKSCRNLRGGLQEVATQLELERIGAQHQAGSDSLLTGMTFFKMREMFFEDYIDDAKYSGYLYGLGSGATHAYSKAWRRSHNIVQNRAQNSTQNSYPNAVQSSFQNAVQSNFPNSYLSSYQSSFQNYHNSFQNGYQNSFPNSIPDIQNIQYVQYVQYGREPVWGGDQPAFMSMPEMLEMPPFEVEDHQFYTYGE
ncbi:CCR4-NOT transcription complex subunit 7-like isoform X1 [Gracilinanus agilis]|uniref:CCR4-NOT transcription complex subunit 7-like isoform X1 n=1 Tax=Gracilinanus agilis TaxID=191870 RepID=UPI001CFEC089|nr:CCR4-NOT transcription complex subunit 7-like isoform X1 [Gracilinanus agilis]